MKIFQVGDLVLAAQELIDAESQLNIPATIWKKWLSSANGRLHGIVAEAGYRYFESSMNINTDGIASLFAIPEDHLSTTTVVRVVAPDDRRPLRRLPAQLQAQMVIASGAAAGSEATAYAQIAQEIWLGPQKPPVGQVYEHRYIPNAPDLRTAADAVEVDVVTPDGESYLLHAMAVNGCIRQRRDPRDHVRERNEAEERLRKWSNLRAMHDRHRHVAGMEASGWSDTGDYTDRSGF